MRYENATAGRYYEAWTTRDLFGHCVVRVWGRVDSERGELRTYPVLDEREGREMLQLVEKQRIKRGYCAKGGRGAQQPLASG